MHKFEHYIHYSSLESDQDLRDVIDNILQMLFLFLAQGIREIITLKKLKRYIFFNDLPILWYFTIMSLHKWEHYIYDNSVESFKYLRYVIDNTLQILFLFLARGIR